MSEFPGYIPEAELIIQKREKAQADALRAEKASRLYNYRCVDFVRKSLPLLKEYAMDKAVPIERKSRLIKKDIVEAGWLVHPVQDSNSEQPTTITDTNLFILSENGLYGVASPVQRGITAYSLLREYGNVNSKNFDITPYAQEFTGAVQSILVASGFEFNDTNTQ